MYDYNASAHLHLLNAMEREQTPTWEHRGLLHERLGRQPDAPAFKPASAPILIPLARRFAAALARAAKLAWARLPHSVPQQPGMGPTRLTIFGGWSRV